MSRKKIIIMVEDEEDFRRAVRLRLESQGYDLLEAENGAVAMSMIKSSRPDLIILDVNMPGMNGFEMTRQLKSDETLRAIPVLMLTVRSQNVDIQKGLESGADAYMTKPFAPVELLKTIRSLI